MSNKNVKLYILNCSLLIEHVPEVKLVGGSGPHEGHIFVGGLPVCDDDHNAENAIVVCR